MKRIASAVFVSLLLAGCVDTTGISAELSRPPKGNPNAVVVITEFADLECPSCRAAHMFVMPPILEKYGNQIRYDFVHFPLRSIHRYTLELAEAAECSADQGKFWEFVDLAFEKQGELKKGAALEWAKTLVDDDDLIDRCARSHIKRDAILAEYDAGVAQGVGGTPTFFVNGKQTPATVDDLSKEIDAQIGGAKMRL